MGISARITSVSAMGRKRGQVLLVTGPPGSTSGGPTRRRVPAATPPRARGRPPAPAPACRPAPAAAPRRRRRRRRRPMLTQMTLARAAQLEDAHGRDGEDQAGERGQQAQPGVEGGQVRLDSRPVPGSSMRTTGIP